MNSAPNSYMFPYVPSTPLPPGHPITPPHLVPPPTPPPHVFPPPPPHGFPPPPPHVTPVPPHVPPRPLPPLPPPHHHPTGIVIVIVSCGGLLFLACLCAALLCFLKKRKKKAVEKTHDEIVKVDEHLKIKEAIEEGPHGKKTVLLTVEDDIHTERVNIDEMKMKESLGQEKMHEAPPPEITPRDLEEGRSSSTPTNHHLKQNS